MIGLEGWRMARRGKIERERESEIEGWQHDQTKICIVARRPRVSGSRLSWQALSYVVSPSESCQKQQSATGAGQALTSGLFLSAFFDATEATRHRVTQNPGSMCTRNPFCLDRHCLVLHLPPSTTRRVSRRQPPQSYHDK